MLFECIFFLFFWILLGVLLEISFVILDIKFFGYGVCDFGLFVFIWVKLFVKRYNMWYYCECLRLWFGDVGGF